ncbi:hypothetical protein BN946_scf184829.g5 [Trametes cinnabarina]|uniref:Uncharacterized protein n=1 Tax=Pycnoporus cinnabarinus TaxID=5643 RepID=A0A060S8T7_PYCCI|nr:hypothetical protein BN946_scf184829.g5 [Trametes cinnabarina]
MWCTRWYLPLLLLPFPIAPPFYLLLWIFSISLHARPCFYCMALLSTMYVSLCYWPPVPIDTPLIRPWSENVTTFADAVLSRMPDLPPEKVPRMMPIEEHCWCHVSGGLFSPINLTKWEESSVNRVVEVLEKHHADLRELERRAQCEAEAAETKGNVTSCAEQFPTPAPHPRRRKKMSIMKFLDLLGLVPPHSKGVNSSDETSHAKQREVVAADSTSTSQEHVQEPPIKLPWFRRDYDLRRFGFAMVLDFGWPSSQS